MTMKGRELSNEAYPDLTNIDLAPRSPVDVGGRLSASAPWVGGATSGWVLRAGAT